MRRWLPGIVIVIVLGVSVGLVFENRDDLLDHMVEQSLVVDAIAVEQGWELISESKRSYRPWCISYRCPAVTRTYVVDLPEGESTADYAVPLVKALLDVDDPVASDSSSALEVGEWDQPTRRCEAGSRCLYSGRSSRFQINIVASSPSIPELTERGVAPGMVAVRFQIGLH